MNGFIRLMIVSAMIATLTSCASRPTHYDDDMALENGDELSSDAGAPDLGASSAPAANDDFADFEGGSQTQPSATQAGNDDLSIEDELNQAEGGQPSAPPPQHAEQAPPPAEVNPSEDPFAGSGLAETPAPTTPEPQPEVAAPVPAEIAPEQPAASAPAQVAETAAPATITDLKFRSNENGGTIIVQGDRPLSYTTRANPDLHQYIIEVENAVLPDRLKRSLNTRDIKGSVGAIDAYQNAGSTTARFVIQMREGVSEPAVQQEGNNLLIVAGGTPAAGNTAQVAAAGGEEGGSSAEGGSAGGAGQVLPNQNLTEFLAGNTQFYGKKISIETNSMDIRDVLSFITEESGVNMVLSDEVKATSV